MKNLIAILCFLAITATGIAVIVSQHSELESLRAHFRDYHDTCGDKQESCEKKDSDDISPNRSKILQKILEPRVKEILFNNTLYMYMPDIDFNNKKTDHLSVDYKLYELRNDTLMEIPMKHLGD